MAIRLFEAVAEDASYEDCLFHLRQELQHNRISFDIFIRVRGFSFSPFASFILISFLSESSRDCPQAVLLSCVGTKTGPKSTAAFQA